MCFQIKPLYGSKRYLNDLHTGLLLELFILVLRINYQQVIDQISLVQLNDFWQQQEHIPKQIPKKGDKK